MYSNRYVDSYNIYRPFKTASNGIGLETSAKLSMDRWNRVNSRDNELSIENYNIAKTCAINT